MENIVIQRFRQFIKEKEKSNKLFCERIEVSESTLKSLFQRDALPTTEILIKVLSKYPDLDLYWLFFGEKTDNENTQTIKKADISEKQSQKSIEISTTVAVKTLINEIKELTILNYKQESELFLLKNNIAASPKEKYGK